MANGKRYDYVLPVGFVLKGGASDYVIENVLGKGGFGVTYKVKASVPYGNIKIDAFFAVKEFFPDICSREADNATIKVPETKRQEIADGKYDFINEGKKLQEVCRLNNNIVNVNEVFEANGTAYYVLEYLEGGDLRKMVKANGKPLTEQQMLDVMSPIGQALQCLHDNRMLHLDIKPDNIVMRRNSNGIVEPVLIDFGIAVHFKNDGTPTSKTPSQGISPGYSPIEQYSQVKRFDPRLDVYAYCATCLYLLTGKDPIEAIDMPNDFVKNALPAGISTNVATAIEQGMAANKNNRTGTISEVMTLLTSKKVAPEMLPEKPQSKPRNDGQNNDTRKMPSNIVIQPKPEPKPGASPKRKNLLIFLSILSAVALIAGFVLMSKRCSTSYNSEGDSSIITSESGNELTFTVDGVSFNMVKVQGGTFTMGATDEQGSDALDSEKPAHEVTLSSYYIGQTEVTQELWEAVMGSNSSCCEGAKRPVENVSWDDCQEFIRKLNQKTGKNFRLPTEAEWEYAARGGNRSQHYKYSGSNNIGDVAWYYDNSGNTTHDVATKRANELGIYDMSGNVFEWCFDWYGDYSSSSQTNPTGPASGSDRVIRGGSWLDDARFCRVSYRERGSADFRYDGLGLRLAL